MDDKYRWWDPNLDPEWLRRVEDQQRYKKDQEWITSQILGTFAIPKESLMGVKVSTCASCDRPVSEMANFVKIGMNKIMHVECYVQNVTGPALSEQEKVLTESFQRREAELVAEINKARAAKGESAVVTKSDAPTVVFDTATWDSEAEKVCKLAVAQIGPTLPLHTLKRYAWFIYIQLRDKKLIQPLSDDRAEESPTEKMLRDKEEMEAWLRSNKKD